ncbi:hypothetical protein LTR24_004225 [Lithohypha guttulata]|uniref:Copper-fist domain-containing protein n=1 Tax=Lithohypha guttulata TaxID=1690604 RepID=A0ABR0KCM6_9EURO|nr:hypothetical protein LTR24_004225 [Lithohypha guttulata]
MPVRHAYEGIESRLAHIQVNRQLLHVNKKGRPVSQCPHCRSLRKNRSQHVKCECHDKSHAKEDCPHLKELQDQNGSPPGSNTCCCGHGERCTCSLKKEPSLDTVPEELTQMLNQAKETQRPRAPIMNNHDSRPTVFTNGHHKPVHKFNDAHNHCGAPYRIPSRSNSQHGHGHRELAQRSTDSLPLPNRPGLHHDSPLHAVQTAAQPMRHAFSEHNSPLLAPTSNPTSMPPFQVEIPPLSPNAYSYSPFDAQSPSLQQGPHLPENIPDHWFTTQDDAHNYGPPNVPELGFIDWSRYGFHHTPTMAGTPTMDTNGMKSLYSLNPGNGLTNSQIPSYAASMEHLNQLNSGFNTSSGDISEVDDVSTYFRPSTLRTISSASNDISSVGATDDNESHRLSAASSYFGTPAGNALAGHLEDLDIDRFISEQKSKQQNLHQQTFAQPSQPYTPDLPQGTYHPSLHQPPMQQQHTPPQSQHTMSTPPESVRGFSVASNPSPDEHTYANPEVPYSIKEAQRYAHLTAAQQEQAAAANKAHMLRSNAVYEDPMWCQPVVDQFGQNRGFTLDDEREDEQWAR